MKANFTFYHFKHKKTVILHNTEWIIKQEGINLHTEREFETITAMSNGFLGTRNSLEEGYTKISTPAVFMAGVYEDSDDDNICRLVKLPDWTRIEVFVDGKKLDLLNFETLTHTRYLDLRKGVCVRNWKNIDVSGKITHIQIIKFVSIYDPNLCFKKIIIQPENYCGRIKVRSGIDGKYNNNNVPDISLRDDIITYSAKTVKNNSGASLSQISNFEFWEDEQTTLNYRQKFIEDAVYGEWEWDARIDRNYYITSLVSIFPGEDGDEASRNYFVREKGVNLLSALGLQEKCWDEIWNTQKVEISSNDNAQNYLNFTVYHLISAGKFSGGNHSIPARTLTGDSYKGLVFWDTEMFLLPFYTYTNPNIARALLMYRYNTLDGARLNSQNEGFKGACYAWESTDTGLETAPSEVILPNGEIVIIYSGSNENHISSDISYAVWNYIVITGDDNFLFDYGAEIIFETARFNASCLKLQEDGLYHINKVVGPDEYHELVDDNAFTNYMAKYNFEIALKTYQIMKAECGLKLNELMLKIGLERKEIEFWKEAESKIYIGFDEQTKLFEQFSGYHELNDIKVSDYEPRSAAMDIILGRESTRNSKVIKQADVLMLLFLFKNRFSDEILKANYEYYEPKTGHGSSLSPGIHSIIAAWSGKIEDAYKYFVQNTQIDLGNGMGNASGGIHIAAAGGTWMTVVMGFAGINSTEKCLHINPCLPLLWEELRFTIRYKNQPLDIKITNESLQIINKGNEDVEIILKALPIKKLQAKYCHNSRKTQDGNWLWI